MVVLETDIKCYLIAQTGRVGRLTHMSQHAEPYA